MAYTPQINYPAYNPYQQMPMQYQQPMQTQIMTQQIYNTRPVASREEALGAQVEFFGPGTLMPDLAHGFVYLKRFNQNTGASEFYDFARLDRPEAQQEQTNEVERLRQELNQLREQFEQFSKNKAKVVKRNDDE